MRKLAVVALFLLVAGCSSDKVCEPGLQIECGCPGDVTGYQTCLSDGSGWGDCDCPCVKDCTGLECGPDPVCGQGKIVAGVHEVAIDNAREILARDHGLDPFQLFCLAGIYVQDASMGVWAAQHLAMEHPVHTNVSGKFAFPRHFYPSVLFGIWFPYNV